MRYLLIVLFSVFVSCGSVTPPASTKVAVSIETPNFVSVKVIRKLPHCDKCYTQGFLVHDGKFYESTGEYGRSKLRVSDIETGKVEREIKLADRYFGEGLALLGGELYQLTWLEGVCLVYDAQTLRQLRTVSYSGEGWGLVARNDSLLLSDGSAEIRVVDPATFKTLRSFTVRDDRGEVRMLNELEMIDGMLYANIYMSPIIAVIDPDTGLVERYLDCSALFGMIGNSAVADVLNGVAYDSVGGRLYLTGKLWDTIFEVQN